jgi:hypothetical protein
VVYRKGNYTKKQALLEAIRLGAKEIIVKIEVTPNELVKMMKKRYLK